MIRLRHNYLLIISGLVWLAVGASLLMMGLKFLLSDQTGFELTALSFVVLGLVVGYFKGKFVLGKSAKRGIERIRSFPNPTSLSNIYSAKYYILLALMIGLGMSMKYLGLPTDVRGVIDVAVGSALINGSMFYFRAVGDVEALSKP